MFLITLSEHMTILIIYLIAPAFYTPIYFFLCNLSFIEICHTLVIVPPLLVNFLIKNSARIVMTACATQMNFFIAFGDVELCAHMQSIVLYNPFMNRNVFMQYWVFSVLHFLAHITLITSSGISHQCLILVCVAIQIPMKWLVFLSAWQSCSFNSCLSWFPTFLLAILPLRSSVLKARKCLLYPRCLPGCDHPPLWLYHFHLQLSEGQLPSRTQQSDLFGL